MDVVLSAAAADDNTPDNVVSLDKLLRRELAAITSYGLALARVRAPLRRGVLLSCRESHDKRARCLAELVRRYGGEPSTRAGPWGWLTRAIETGALLLGEEAAIRALHEGERRGLERYVAELDRLSGDAHRVVRREVLPEQRASTHAMEQLVRGN